MSVTYIIVKKPGQLGVINPTYVVYPCKAEGFKVGPGELLREYPVYWLTPNHNAFFEAHLVSLNSETFHTDKVYVILDVGYADQDALVADVNADPCSDLWLWLRDWMADLAIEFKVETFSTMGFRGGIQALVFDAGAETLRKRFTPSLKAV
jgi:hypothetical protein